MPWLRFILLPFLLWALIGCQTLGEKRQAALLVETLRNYEAAVRWGSMQHAQRFVSLDLALTSTTRSKEIRIINYEVVQGPTQVNENKALQAAVIQYVHASNQTVKELLDQQVWTYDAKTEKWTLQSPLPVFK